MLSILLKARSENYHCCLAWLFIDYLLIIYWLFIDYLLIIYWLFIDCLLIVYWLFIDCLLIVYWLFIDWLFIDYLLIIYWLFWAWPMLTIIATHDILYNPIFVTRIMFEWWARSLNQSSARYICNYVKRRFFLV